MQRSSEQPLVGEERYVTTLITAAKETTHHGACVDTCTTRCERAAFSPLIAGPQLSHMRNPKSRSLTSFSSVSVWIGNNDTKTLMWIEIICFVFAYMKSGNFESTLVWVEL